MLEDLAAAAAPFLPIILAQVVRRPPQCRPCAHLRYSVSRRMCRIDERIRWFAGRCRWYPGL
jgi:hypothetical protein